MKWIGQHIYDFIARFRNDVYLEDVSTGTIASGGNLGLDSNNKIVKATDSAPDADASTKGIVELATTIETTTGTDATRAVTPEGLKDGYRGSTNVTTLGTIGTGTWQGTAITKDYIAADQRNITAVGEIVAGTWQGTPIATAYIADDAVTEDKLANTLLAEIDANTAKVTNVSTNLSQTTSFDSLRIDSSDGTGVIIAEASGSIAGVMTVAHHDKLDGIEDAATADQSKSDINGLAITTVGTIDSGVWQGTAIAHAYIGNDAIDGDNIADDSVNSEHYVDGSIDTDHIGDAQVTVAKLHGDAVQTAAEIASSFGDNDTSLLTAAAVDDRINTKHTYVYLHIHGRSNTGNVNWHFQDASADGEFNWETDGGADAFTDTTYTTVDSSTVSLDRAVGVMGMVIPYDCTLVGFKAIGRDLSGNDAFKAGLWSSPAYSSYGGNTSAQTYTLRAVAGSTYSGGGGASFNGICKLDDLSQSYPLSAGQILLPSIAESDINRTYLSMTIVLKVPIIP